jgi:hypothetical protein
LVPEPCETRDLPVTSSLPTEQPREQVELFRDVLQALESSRVPYAVSGAFALRQHTGICRFTKDLDLFVTARNSDSALACLRQAGMECDVTDPVWLAKAHRDGYFVDLITGMRGEAAEIFPLLGTSRLAEVIDRHGADLVVHGHAHHGKLDGRTAGGVPVHNVAITLLQAQSPSSVYRVFDL